MDNWREQPDSCQREEGLGGVVKKGDKDWEVQIGSHKIVMGM